MCNIMVDTEGFLSEFVLLPAQRHNNVTVNVPIDDIISFFWFESLIFFDSLMVVMLLWHWNVDNKLAYFVRLTSVDSKINFFPVDVFLKITSQ